MRFSIAIYCSNNVHGACISALPFTVLTMCTMHAVECDSGTWRGGRVREARAAVGACTHAAYGRRRAVLQGQP